MLDIEFRDASYYEGSFGRKKVRRTEAYIGQIRAYGATKTEAKKALEERIAEQCERIYERRYLTGASHDGRPVTFCLYYCDGWMYDIHTSDHSYPSSCGFGPETTYTEALESMKRHFEQYTEKAA